MVTYILYNMNITFMDAVFAIHVRLLSQPLEIRYSSDVIIGHFRPAWVPHEAVCGSMWESPLQLVGTCLMSFSRHIQQHSCHQIQKHLCFSFLMLRLMANTDPERSSSQMTPNTVETLTLRQRYLELLDQRLVGLRVNGEWGSPIRTACE